MKTVFVNASLVLPDRILPDAWLLIENGKILRFGTGVPEAAHETVDVRGDYLSPGFIDVHCHGGGGGSFNSTDMESHIQALKMHLSHGTTSITPTPSATDAPTVARLAEIKRALDTREDLPHHLGYFVEAMSFAQPHPDMAPKDAKPPVITEEAVAAFIRAADGTVNRVMGAPELEGGMMLGRELKKAGITACIGHSNATFAQCREAMLNGYTTVTHLYSVMSTVTRDMGFRRGGIVEAGLLLDDLDTEIICDGCHLPPELIQLAVKCKGYDRLMLVSDCGPLGGFPEGEYELDFGSIKTPVFIEDGVCKPPARNCFLGSIATGDRLVRTVYKKAGIPLWAAVRMATKTPARHCGYAGIKGEIAVGCDADLVRFNDQIEVSGVWLMGRQVV